MPCDWRKLTIRQPHELTRAIEGSALSLAVVSPAYVTSDYCRKELDQFEAAAHQQTGGTIIESISRVVPVMPNPVDRTLFPPLLAQVLSYEFFAREPDPGRFREFDPDNPEYRRRLDDLAQDIAKILRRVRFVDRA